MISSAESWLACTLWLHVFIPRSTNFGSQDYIITKIAEESFVANLNIKSINFSEDSEFLSIGKNAFLYSYSKLETLYIPSKFLFFDENWFFHTISFNTIYISSKNTNFKYLDDTNKIVIRKSDPNVDKFDSLVFISHDIKEITIPSIFKQICYCSFPQNSITIKLERKSSLEIIQNDSINLNSKSLQIPSTVKYIGQIGSLLSSIFYELISPDNPHFKYIDNSMLVGKSDPNKDEFDSLLSVDLNIEKAVIPSTIKYIKTNCFNNCRKLNTVEISAKF